MPYILVVNFLAFQEGREVFFRHAMRVVGWDEVYAVIMVLMVHLLRLSFV